MLSFLSFFLLVLQTLSFEKLQIVYSKQNDPKLGSVLKSVNQQLKGILEYKQIDCNKQDHPHCPQKPFIIFQQNDQQEIYTGDIDIQSFVKEINNKLLDPTIYIQNHDDHANLMKKTMPKVLFFSNNSELDLQYKYLANKFANQMQFGQVGPSFTQLKTAYKIEKIPALLVFNDQNKPSIYQGEHELLKMSEFLQRKDNYQHLQNLSDIYDHIYDDNGLFLMSVYKNLEDLTPLNQIKERFGNMFSYFTYHIPDKQTYQQIKVLMNDTKIPQIILFPFLGDNRDNLVHFPNDVTVEKFTDFMKTILHKKVPEVNENSLNQFIQNQVANDITPVILFTSTEPNLSLQYLASSVQYKRFVAFSYFVNPSKEIMDQYHVDKLPKLVTLTKQKSEAEEFAMGLSLFHYKLHVNHIMPWINGLINEDPMKKTLKPWLQKIATNQDIDSICQDKTCIVSMLDLQNDEVRVQQQKTLKSTLYNSALAKRSLFSDFVFATIDAKCHPEIYEQLDVPEQIPYLFVYKAEEKKVMPLIGTFENDSLELFLKKVKLNKMGSRTLYEKLFLEEKDCFQHVLEGAKSSEL